MASDSAVEIGPKQIFVEETKETISIAYYTLNVAEGVDLDIAVGDKDEDEISEAIANQTYFVSPAFHFLFTLMKPGDIILDLGAHIGTFSFAAAALGCQVISVEASPHNVALLKATAVKNSFNQVQIISSAVSNCSGTVEFVPGGPYGLVANPTINSGCITVPAITGDDLLANLGLDRVDLIKMDIEGSEIRAIEGMSQLLAREDAPPILYEGNGHALRFFGETSNRLIGTLERFGYRSYFVEAGQLMPVQPGDLQWICTVDYLAVKHFPDDLSGWQVVGPMSLEEKIAQILFSC
jgi:FkbM family methyltransferase